MKASILYICMLLCLYSISLAQPTGWSVDSDTHTSYRYSDGGPFDQESSHWMPGQIAFWTNNTYNTGSWYNAGNMRLFSPSEDAELMRTSLIFRNLNAGATLIDRVRLDYDGLSVVNSNSWAALDAHVWGNAGQVDLYTGANANKLVHLGSTTQNSGRGNLRLYGPDGQYDVYSASSSANFGYTYHYGTNQTPNLYFGVAAGNTSTGRILVYDDAGVAQAGVYINAAGQGVVWGDQKNFRIDDPTSDTQDIWYASLEGPEVAAYERGTGQLVDGEIFIPFSDHFQKVVNPKTMTVLLTPMHWDTYGLAVVDKRADGFLVRELKGGTGDFEFDWEVKCIRSGHESFEIYRDKMEQRVDHAPTHSPSGRFTEKVKGKAPNQHKRAHQHNPACVHGK